jgi:hypothetical protein
MKFVNTLGQGGSTVIEWITKLIEFGNWLGWLLNIIGILGYPVTLYLWMRDRHRYQRLIQKIRNPEAAKGAVAVAFGIGVPVKAEVEKYLKDNFQDKIPLSLIYEKRGFFSREDLLIIHDDIKDKMNKLMETGQVTEVHLFYGGPIFLAAALGAMVDNWRQVHWYSHSDKTGYEYAFTLDNQAIKGGT